MKAKQSERRPKRGEEGTSPTPILEDTQRSFCPLKEVVSKSTYSSEYMKGRYFPCYTWRGSLLTDRPQGRGRREGQPGMIACSTEEMNLDVEKGDSDSCQIKVTLFM